jgi:hypothetical protein
MREPETASAIRRRSELAWERSKLDFRKIDIRRGTTKSNAPSIIPAISNRQNLRRK